MTRYEKVEGWLFADPSTRTGLCLVQDGNPVLDTLVMRRDETNRASELAAYQSDVSRAISKACPAVVCVESYAINARGNAVHKQVELGSAVRVAAAAYGTPVVEINPSLWKSLTFRLKKGTKAERAEYVRRAGELTGVDPFAIRNADEADALLMAWSAALILSDRTRNSSGIAAFRNAVFAATMGRGR